MNYKQAGKRGSGNRGKKEQNHQNQNEKIKIIAVKFLLHFMKKLEETSQFWRKLANNKHLVLNPFYWFCQIFNRIHCILYSPPSQI